MARCKMRDARPRAVLGTAIAVGSLAANILGQGLGLWNSHKQQKAQAKAMQEQLDLQKRQLELQNLNNQAAALNSGVLAQQDEYPQDIMYANGGKINNKRIAITDGGYGVPLGHNSFLLRGSSHADVNEQGKHGIGLIVGNKPVEAEDGEVIQKAEYGARIFSDNLQMPNGMSPSEYVQAGGDSDLAFRWQEAFKKHVSQQKSKYPAWLNGVNNEYTQAKQIQTSSPMYWGLFYTSVGKDKKKNNLFEHIK